MCLNKHFFNFSCIFLYPNIPSDLRDFANSRPSVLNFKSFSQSLEHFFLTVRQNNFGNKIPALLTFMKMASRTLIKSMLNQIYLIA